ncbi:hypothetical protein [Vibrio casei]|uniref:DUF3106 domain-containing protein n=1 Tax=Vibrio casei TaxID=673372 RepID=A0A368LM81_9VIBR|nr:hypothetical protein [Vibrio casei]RCS72905.1 hypothetical protein CIK83_04370 [Vibrio casei]SJN32274.1 hypothetical protein FM109_10990 [Vibrio casei]
MLKWNKQIWQKWCLALFVTFGLAACSTTSSTNASYVYTDSWWYDDYWYYQNHVYPNCCHGDGEFKNAVNSWWHTLDPDQQAEIKDKVDNWKEGLGPDVSALKSDFNKKWQALPPEKQQQISEKRQEIQTQMGGNSLSSEQKKAVKTKWQSKNRPTLQRSQIHRPIRMPASRPSGFGGGGRLGGGGLRR